MDLQRIAQGSRRGWRTFTGVVGSAVLITALWGEANGLASPAAMRTPQFPVLLQKALSSLQLSNSLSNSKESFQFAHIEKDPGFSTLKFQRSYLGVPVYGKKARVLFAADGKIISEESFTEEKFVVPTGKGINPPTPSAKPYWLYLKSEKQYRLAYLVSTPELDTFISVENGETLLELPKNFHLKREIYSGATALAHQHLSFTGRPTSTDPSLFQLLISDFSGVTSTDTSAQNIHRHLGKIYDYFKNGFGRLSYDGEDSPIQAAVHIGIEMGNAYWSEQGQMLIFGDGDGDQIGDLTRALDATTHEYTHAVINRTAELINSGEPGALAESLADFFGKMVDYTPGNWDFGGKVLTEKATTNAVRNLMNPEIYDQPGHMKSPLRVSTQEKCTLRNDLCGVHVNNGIINRALALITESIGKEKAEKLVYHVLAHKLHSYSGFQDFADETVKSCSVVFSNEDRDCVKVMTGFEAVGLFESNSIL